MSDDLLKLYQDVVLEHNRRPRNFVAVDPATHRGLGHNPLCGDTIELTLAIKEGVIHRVGFQGESCAIATASASLLTAVLQGKSITEAEQVMQRFRQALEESADEALPEELEPLLTVRTFPSRIKCATLPWASLEYALSESTDASSASTESSGHGM